MGFGVAAAAALLGSTALVSAYALSDAWFDSQAQLRDAWLGAEQRLEDSAHSSFSLSLSHQNGAGHVTLTLVNTGSVSIEASELDVLLNGVVYRGADVTVTGHTGTLWHPDETLTLFLHGVSDLNDVFKTTSPTRATVAAANGAMAFWGA